MDRGSREGGGRRTLIRSNDEAHSCRSPHGCTHGLHAVHSAAGPLAGWRLGTGAEAPTQIIDDSAVTPPYGTGAVVVTADKKSWFALSPLSRFARRSPAIDQVGDVSRAGCESSA